VNGDQIGLLRIQRFQSGYLSDYAGYDLESAEKEKLGFFAKSFFENMTEKFLGKI